jgi:hypothetical protein
LIFKKESQMKKVLITLSVFILSISVLCGMPWAQCPDDPFDNGECDSLNVICLDCDKQEGEVGPWSIRFPLLVSHDQTDPIDSIIGFTIPLAYTHTNPSAYCSVSADWNATSMLYLAPDFKRSIYRHMYATDYDTTSELLYSNRMALLEEDFSFRGWNYTILTLDTTANFWFTVVPTGSQDQRWWEGDRVLLATMTLRIQDTMHVCVDTTYWPPAMSLSFFRSDAEAYIPRLNLPDCFWVGSSQLQVTSPNGGEEWVVGETYDITWVSENFSGGNVDIEFSTDGGGSWIPIATDSPNDGVHPWLIPDAVSSQCLVRVSDSEDGVPSDESNDFFSIILTAYFELEAMPDTNWVKQGDSTEYHITLTSLYGFDSPCTLTVEGIPSLSTYNLDPPMVIPTGTSVLSIVTDSITPLGSYQILIIATEQTKQIVDSSKVLLYVSSSINRKPELTVPGPQTVYGGLQIVFPVIGVDSDSVDTLTLTKSGVGNLPCYPRVSPVVCYFQWTTAPEDTLYSPYTVVFNVDDGRDSTDTDSLMLSM